MKLALSYILSLLFIIALASCEKIETRNEIPDISFKSLEAKDTLDILGNETRLIRLTFKVVDGDGDIGLLEGDTLPPYNPGSKFYYNFFPTILLKANNQYDTVPNITASNYRIPYIETDNSKSYKADISIEFSYPREYLDYDTVAIHFFLVDKALHSSDTISTPDFGFLPF